MTRTENEQEFVLGNKQLLSAFFVVVALLGVFFVMGFIIGRNTEASAASKKGSAGEPAAAAGTPAIPADSSPAPSDPPPVQPEARVPKTAEKAAETLPEKVDKPVAERLPRVENPIAKPSAVESTSGHTYLQVMAVKRSVADEMVKVLKERGFPALLGESSKPELLRVLVGPYAEAESLGKAKSDLKKMGFDAVVSK